MDLTKEEIRSYVMAQIELSSDKEILFNDTVSDLAHTFMHSTPAPKAPVLEDKKAPKPPSLTDFMASAPKVVQRTRQRVEDFKDCEHLELLHNKIHNYSLFKTASGHLPILNGKGNHPNPPLMLVGFAPNEDDLKLKTHFGAAQGQLLSGMLEKVLGVQRQLCYTTYFYKSLKNGPLLNEDRRWLDGALKKEVELVKPRALLFFGKELAEILFNDPRNLSDFSQSTLEYANTPAFITFSLDELLEHPPLRHQTLPLLKLLKQSALS